MTQRTLTEEKRELNLVLSKIIAKNEQAEANEIVLIDIIPIAKGLKVVYKTSKSAVQRWARTVRYSDLANND